MSAFGYKILNIQAGTLYEYNSGVRDYFQSTPAMLINSLFTDFLINNGMKVNKVGATRDIICLNFDFGTKSYEEDRNGIIKRIETTEDNEEKEKLKEILRKVEMNENNYEKKSKEEIRKEYYVDGVKINYITKNKHGEITKKEEINYKMLYRTPGKAKKGACVFICDRLYKKTLNFLHMGIKLKKNNAPVVEIGAYSSLITSSSQKKIKIDPKNILVLEDVDSFFKTKVVSVETDEDKHCVAKTMDEYKLKNTLFDGQALIDESTFPEWGDGYILLRQHMCKVAAFKSNIQLFFKDYFGDVYEYAVVEDMWGNQHMAKDIVMITTDNAMKWLKFDADYDYWCEWVGESKNNFGVVKTAHKSKLGDVQRMSYQMINALDESIMENVVSKSVEYIEALKTDTKMFIDYLRSNANFSNDYEALVALYEQDPDFARSEYFRHRKEWIIKSYVTNFKSGKIIQNADNLVIVGSPYAMLLHSVGESVENDDTFSIEEDTIQCHTKRFEDGEHLACFRSPFNSKNNMGYLHNVYHWKFDRYFDFGEQIIAVNMVHTDFQDRNNGSDQDSDSIYTTNQKDIVGYARYCYLNFPTIVNNIPKEKNCYSNTMEDFAEIDSNLAAASLAIGESSNLAQIALTYSYNTTTEEESKKMLEYVCILSVLAQVAIDSAKRRFDVDLVSEIKRIKKDMNIKGKGLPEFWGIVKKDVNKKRINKTLRCPMNYLCNVEIKKFKDKSETLPMSHFFVKYDLDMDRKKSRKLEELIQNYSLDVYNYNTSDDEEYLLLKSDFNNLIEDIRKSHMSKNYEGLMSWLINRAFSIGKGVSINKSSINSTINTNKSLLMKVLFDVNKECFLRCFSKNIKKNA